MVSPSEADSNAPASTGKDESLVALFERSRPRLLGAAYRMVGSLSDAEDILQEAFLRMRSVAMESLDDPEAYLFRVVSRLGVDHLRSARVRRESYVGPWLPEPLLGTPPHQERDSNDAETMGTLRDDVSMALLVALESLSPLERAAFLLHDVFDLDYDAIGDVLERSEEACRALATRGRKHVRERRPRFPSSQERAERLVSAFWQSIQAGDIQALTNVLSSDVRLVPDGGGRVAAATRILEGVDRVARFLMGVQERFGVYVDVDVVPVGGQPGLIVRLDGKISQVCAFEFEDDRIRTVYAVRNPDKLAHLGEVVAARDGAPARA